MTVRDQLHTSATHKPGIDPACPGCGPTPVLLPGVIYSADNGRLICLKCAGSSAKYTGRDISGQKVEAMNVKDAGDWMSVIGRPMACERGCTSYAHVAPAVLRAILVAGR